MIEFFERIDRIHSARCEHRAPQREGIDRGVPSVRAESGGSAGGRDGLGDLVEGLPSTWACRV